jgi:MFS transporter, DHA1 family, multidrug resistance protein
MRLPVVPLHAHALGVDTARIGIINAVFFLMAGLLSFPLGMVSDRWGSKRLAAIGLLVLAVTSGGLFVCRTFVHFTMAYLMLGVGIAAFGPTMMTLVSVISPRSHLGRSYGWYTTAIFCGMSLGPAVGGFMASSIGAPQVFLAAGAILFLDLGLLLWLLPRHLQRRTSSDLQGRGLRSMRKLLQNRPLLGCWTITLGACFGLGTFTSFLPLHAQNKGLGVSQIGIVFFTQGLCNGASRIPFGRLSDKVARRSTLVVVGIVLYAMAMTGCGLSQSMGQFVWSAGLLGIGMGLAFTSVGALIVEVVPPASRGSAMGGYNTCIYLGMMLSSMIMGAVNATFGFATGFILTAGVNLVFLGLFSRFFKGFVPSQDTSEV